MATRLGILRWASHWLSARSNRTRAIAAAICCCFQSLALDRPAWTFTTLDFPVGKGNLTYRVYYNASGSWTAVTSGSWGYTIGTGDPTGFADPHSVGENEPWPPGSTYWGVGTTHVPWTCAAYPAVLWKIERQAANGWTFATLVIDCSSVTTIDTIAWTGSSGPLPPWKMRFSIENKQPYGYYYTALEWINGQWVAPGNAEPFWVESGGLFGVDVEPSDSTAKSKIALARVDYNADGEPTYRAMRIWDETYAGWQQTTGSPTTTTTVVDTGIQYTGTPTSFTTSSVVQDTHSQTGATRSIAFGTSTGTASESTLQTGFSAVQSAGTAGNAINKAGFESVGGKLDQLHSDNVSQQATLERIRTNTLAPALDPNAIGTSAQTSGNSSSSSVRSNLGQNSTAYQSIGGGSGAATPLGDQSGPWLFTVNGTSVNLNPFQYSGVAVLSAIARYIIGWAAALMMVWWAWRETFNTWIYTTVVPQAAAASSIPLVSTGSAATMAGIISVSMLAIPTFFVTWYGVGVLPGSLGVSPFSTITSGSSGEVWLSRFLWMVEQWLPWATLFSQIVLRFVYHFGLASAFALSSTVIKFAVG